jgi:DNA-binding transcriptional MerR regulator
MKLSIEQVSKLTKLSVATLRVYVSRQKLGTKAGNRRVFSQSDVQKILKKSKGSNGKSKGKTKPNVAKAVIQPAQIRATKQSTIKTKALLSKTDRAMPKPEMRSFWRSLFGTRKPKQKVNLLQVKTRR